MSKRRKNRRNKSDREALANLPLLLDMAVQHHNDGRLEEALNIYNQILESAPEHPDALHLSGLIAHQSGENEKAVRLIEHSLAAKPDFIDALGNLGLLYSLVQQPQKAVTTYRKLLDLMPNSVEALNNLANALREIGQFEEALEYFRHALSQNAQVALLHNNYGNVLIDSGAPEKAVESYRKALELDPDYTEALLNLGHALEKTGHVEEAIGLLQKNLEHYPDNLPIADGLLNLLDRCATSPSVPGPYPKAQKALKAGAAIADASPKELYQYCSDILDQFRIQSGSLPSQIWRGRVLDQNCDRHKVVFETFNVIPEYCFGCFKISVSPRTIVDLFELAAIFDRLVLPNNNSRKCMVETRPAIPGPYKGLIYCHSVEEGEEIMGILGEEFSLDMPFALKRGCSEYPFSYPDYNRFDESGSPILDYDPSWRSFEEKVDRYRRPEKYPPLSDTYNHTHPTLLEALTFKTWISYAATIGDNSYLTISEKPVEFLPGLKRQIKN